MGMLAAYLYFFEPYGPEVFDPHVIDSIFRMFPATFGDTWMANKTYYTDNRRV